MVFHVKEQIGLGVEKKDIKIVHIMHYPLGKKLYILLKTKKFNGKLENKIPMEYSDIKKNWQIYTIMNFYLAIFVENLN